MNFPTTPSLRLDKTIGHPMDSMIVAGFEGRDTHNGLPIIALKGAMLPGDGDCVGIYSDIIERLNDNIAAVFVLGEKEVHGTGWQSLAEAPIQTFEDAPLFGRATMACVSLDEFEMWDREEVTIE